MKSIAFDRAKGIILGCVVALAFGLLGFGALEMSKGQQLHASASETIMSSESHVKSKLTVLYRGEKRVVANSVNVVKTAEKKLNTTEYAQETVASQYNSSTSGKDIDVHKIGGICWASTCTTLLDFYANKENVVPNSIYYPNLRRNTIINKVITTAIDKGYFNFGPEDGLSCNEMEKVLNSCIKSLGISKYEGDCTFTRLNPYDKIVNHIDAGRPCAFSVPSHIMTGCGYANFKVSYVQKNIFGKKKNKAAIEKMIVVNDTYGKTPNYTYYPESAIKGINPYFGYIRISYT